MSPPKTTRRSPGPSRRKPAAIWSGNAVNDGRAYRRWFIGHFVAERNLRRSKHLEVKLTRHDQPYFEDGSTANRTSTSLSIRVAGRCVYHFSENGGRTWTRRTLSKRGDYVVWAPGVLHCLDVPTSCEMMVVRWPSVRADKIPGPRPPRAR